MYNYALSASGGGMNGATGNTNNSDICTPGTGGTQSSGYLFGAGGDAINFSGADSGNVWSGGGGGGWYGGDGANRIKTGCTCTGGGGSGYIGGVTTAKGVTKQMYMYSTGCTASTAAETKTTCTSSTGAHVANAANTGNGYAIITYLGT